MPSRGRDWGQGGRQGRGVELGAGMIVSAEVADDKSGRAAAGRAIRMYARMTHKSTEAITSAASITFGVRILSSQP